MTDQIQTRMTAAEFFDLPETNTPSELIDGVLIVSPSPATLHQRSVYKIAREVESLMPDGEVFIAPLDVYLDDENVPQPDVMWVSAQNKSIVGKHGLMGVPDLVVEVFSPGSERQDRGKKFDLYEKHGVREDWMTDTLELYIEVHQLKDGRFVRLGVFGPGDSFISAVLGDKTVEVKHIFPE